MDSRSGYHEPNQHRLPFPRATDPCKKPAAIVEPRFSSRAPFFVPRAISRSSSCRPRLPSLPRPELPPRPSWNEQRLEENRPYVLRVALLSSTTFYAMLVSVNFDPKAEAKFEQAFGAEPLGMTAQHFAILVETILFIPFIWVSYYFGMIIIQARREGMSPHSVLSVFEAERITLASAAPS